MKKIAVVLTWLVLLIPSCSSDNSGLRNEPTDSNSTTPDNAGAPGGSSPALANGGADAGDGGTDAGTGGSAPSDGNTGNVGGRGGTGGNGGGGSTGGTQGAMGGSGMNAPGGAAGSGTDSSGPADGKCKGGTIYDEGFRLIKSDTQPQQGSRQEVYPQGEGWWIVWGAPGAYEPVGLTCAKFCNTWFNVGKTCHEGAGRDIYDTESQCLTDCETFTNNQMCCRSAWLLHAVDRNQDQTCTGARGAQGLCP